jgi:hypothetical protein
MMSRESVDDMDTHGPNTIGANYVVDWKGIRPGHNL